MRKLHQNIFYYYSGGETKGKDVDKQLEDNTTKALINVLENISSEMQKAFIQRIIGKKLRCISEITCLLQSSSIPKDISEVPIRILLGISKDGKVNERATTSSEDTIPDAWMWCDDFVILIENKVYGELSRGQLRQHKRLLGGKCEEIKRSWVDDIYPIVNGFARKKDLNEKDTFIFNELKRYLEVIGMSKFEGFDKQDFMRKYCDDKDREEFDYLKNKFDSLANSVDEKLKSSGFKFSGATPDFEERNLGYSAFYKKYIGPKGGKYKYYKHAHFSIFEDNGVSIKLHVVGPHLRNLGEKLRDGEKRKQFVSLVKKLKNSKQNYEITLSERKHIGKETGKRYHTTSSCEYTIYPTDITNKHLEPMIDMILDSKIKKWFSIYCTFDPKKAEEKGKGIVDEIVNIFTKDWWPLYEYVTKPA